MALVDTLQNTARKVGIPVDQFTQQIEQVYEERLRPELLKRLSKYVIPFVRRSGVKVLELESGRVLCRMPLKGNVNHIGTMYAGALFTLAEFPGGPLMLATFGMKRFIPIVTKLDLDFVKVAKTDVTIELTLSAPEIERIESETLANGQSEFVVEGELKDINGNVVARSRAVYQMRPKRR